MEYRLLGPLEVRAGDGPLPLGGTKQRALLALLLLNANRVVSRERLIDEVWGDAPPQTAVTTVQVYVSRLRKLLPAETLRTRPPGYLLAIEPDSLDLARFERLVEEARAADPERASRALREALELWRGPSLKEFDEPFFRIEAGRLEDLRLVALEDRIEADLSLGRHAQVAGEIDALIAEHPHRERLRGQLMLALYRSGRQADALEAYRDARAALDELGLEPGERLRALERAVLTQDASLDLPPARLLPEGQPIPLPGPLVPASPFPFVGRQQELVTVRGALEHARSGEGALILLTGEAGAGKTRFVRELAREAAASGVLVLYGVSDAAVSTPYQPLREWLEFLRRVCEPVAFNELLGDATLAPLIPGLEGPTGPAPTSSEEAKRYALQAGATKLLTRLSSVQPLLAVVDDLHWSDGETLHLLRNLARAAPAARLLVVAAFRDPGEEIGFELADTVADLSRLDAVTRLALGNLSVDDVGEFIRASTDAEVSRELASEIGELTDGTPLLLCELWRDLRESGAVVVRQTVHVSQPVSELRGPRRIRDVVRQRMQRLTPAARSLLDAAAVAGPRFEQAVIGKAVATLEPAAVVAALDEAAAAGLLEELPEPMLAWRFTHELVRRAVYDRLPRSRRIELHLRVGEALEHAHASDLSRVLPELAYHFNLAAPLAGVERAVEYNLRAANAAVGASSYDEAVARFSDALELGIADRRQRVRFQAELAVLLSVTGRTVEADRLLDDSLEAATALDERGVAARVRLHRASQELWSVTVDSGPALAIAEDALEIFRSIGDSRGVADATRNIALALQRRGQLAACRKFLERAVAEVSTSGDQHIRREVTGSLGYSIWMGPTPTGEAISRYEELLASNRRDRALEAILRRFLSAVLAMSGRFDEARELIRRSDAVLAELNQLLQFWVFRDAAAEAKELLGDRTGAQQELTAKWLRFREFRGRNPDPRAMQPAYLLALMCCEDGRWDDAERFVAYGRTAPEPLYYTRERVLGLAANARLAAHRGELDEALALADRAVRVADAADVLDLRARLWLTLADVRRLRGEVGEADAAVAIAVDLYERKGNVTAAALARAAHPALDSARERV
jgi:DNA-binding SARP family transcriptional activator